MGTQRDDLLGRILVDVATNGLGERSLRDIATAVGSSHRMLLYHFGSRAGLVEAIVAGREVPKRITVEEGVFTQEQAAAELPKRKY